MKIALRVGRKLGNQNSYEIMTLRHTRSLFLLYRFLLSVLIPMPNNGYHIANGDACQCHSALVHQNFYFSKCQSNAGPIAPNSVEIQTHASKFNRSVPFSLSLSLSLSPSLFLFCLSLSLSLSLAYPQTSTTRHQFKRFSSNFD